MEPAIPTQGEKQVNLHRFDQKSFESSREQAREARTTLSSSKTVVFSPCARFWVKFRGLFFFCRFGVAVVYRFPALRLERSFIVFPALRLERI